MEFSESEIKTKIIFNKTDKKLKIPLSEIKFLPAKYSSNMAINIYPEYTNAWHNKGWTLNKLGKYEEAVKAYDMDIKLNPNNINPRIYVNFNIHSLSLYTLECMTT